MCGRRVGSRSSNDGRLRAPGTRRGATVVAQPDARCGAAVVQAPDASGGTFDSSSATGHLLVIDFFAAYCRPCQRKLPELEALHRQRPELSIVGVSLDDSRDAAWKSVARHHLTFPVVHDSNNVLAGRLRVTELPVSFVVDGQGKIRWVGGPDQPEDALARVVAALTSSP